MTLRARLVVAAVLAAAVVAGGVLLERGLGVARRPPGPVSAGDLTGAWVCPHGGGEGWRTWVSVANPSSAETTVRVTTFSEDEEPAMMAVTLAPRSSQLVAVPAASMAAASRVDFFGAPVAAGIVAARPGDAGLAAEPCTRSGRRWRLVDGTTVRGQRQWLVLANPTAVEAVADVTLVTEERPIRPGPLRGIFLPARRVTAVQLNRYALGERTLSLIVEATLGRVTAGLVGVGEPDGLREAVGMRSDSGTWFLPGGGDDGPGEVVVLAGARDAPFRLRVQALTGQEEVLDEPSVDAGRTATFDVSARDASIALLAEGSAQFVAARRFHRREAGDLASTAGTPGEGNSWVVPPAVPEGGGRQLLVVQNPGRQQITARIELLGASGPVRGPAGGRVTVDAGRSRVVELTPAEGGAPVAVVVIGEDGPVVPASVGLADEGFAVALGVRVESLDRLANELSS
jgi:hypothetical protein